jgi:hypothetical protein
MLKPHADSADGTWRGEFDPLDPERWFASYRAFLMHYVELASTLGVEGLMIGTEYRRLSGNTYREYWCSLIREIRAQFPGILTYAANASRIDDEFTGVSFWDQLDVIGLDAYFALTRHWRPTVEQLVAAWHHNADRTDLVGAIRAFASSQGKPVIFSEIGYRSVTGANTQPWNYSLEGSYDAEEQANCYQAFFETWMPHASWMLGAFWWNWQAIPGPPALTDYTPQRKPAREVLSRCYGLGPVTAGPARSESA